VDGKRVGGLTNLVHVWEAERVQLESSKGSVMCVRLCVREMSCGKERVDWGLETYPHSAHVSGKFGRMRTANIINNSHLVTHIDNRQ